MPVLSKSGALSQMVDGDALWRAATPVPATVGGASHKLPAPPPVPKKNTTARVHLTDGGGRLTHNRKGQRLCVAFQSDQCSSSGGLVCPKDGSMHQCYKCLSPAHGGDRCSGSAARAPQFGSSRAKGGKGSQGDGPGRPQL